MGLIQRRRLGWAGGLRVEIHPKRQEVDDGADSPDSPDTSPDVPGQPESPDSPDSPDVPSPTETQTLAPPPPPPAATTTTQPPPAIVSTIPTVSISSVPAARPPPPPAAAPVVQPPPVQVAPPPAITTSVASRPPAAELPPAATQLPPVVSVAPSIGTPPLRLIPTMTAVPPELIKTFPVVLNPEVTTTAEPPSPTTTIGSIDSPSPTSTTFPPVAPPVQTTNPGLPFQGQLPGGIVSSLPPAAGGPAPTPLNPALPLETGQGLVGTVSGTSPLPPAATGPNTTSGEQRAGAPEPVGPSTSTSDSVHAGIALGSIAGTALIFAFFFWAWRWRRRNVEMYRDPTMDAGEKKHFPPVAFANRLRERLRWTTTTTSTDPLWGGTVGGASSNGGGGVVPRGPGPVKTNSNIMDEMFAAAYAAEAGMQGRQGYGGYYPDEKRMTQQTNQEFFLAPEGARGSNTQSQVFRWLRSRSAAPSEPPMMPPGTPRTERSGNDVVPPLPPPAPPSQQSRWSFSTKKTASYYNNSRWDRDGEQPGLVSMYAGSEAVWPLGKPEAAKAAATTDKRKSGVSARTSMPGEAPWPDTPDPAWEMMPPPNAVTRK